jgi:hypothetical protein
MYVRVSVCVSISFCVCMCVCLSLSVCVSLSLCVQIVVSATLIATDVPVHWVHGSDLSGCVGGCACGEPSLLHQRGKGWDVSRHRFTWKYLRMVLRLRELRWRAVLARLIALHDVAMAATDWASLAYTVVFLVFFPNRLLLLYGFVAAWAIQIVVHTLFNVVVLAPRGLDVAPESIALFSLLYKFPSLLVLRLYALAYTCFYYVPCVRNHRPVKRRLRDGDSAPAHAVASMASTWSLSWRDTAPAALSPTGARTGTGTATSPTYANMNGGGKMSARRSRNSASATAHSADALGASSSSSVSPGGGGSGGGSGSGGTHSPAALL